MTISVTTAPIGSKLYRVLMFADGVLIGEYERSQTNHIELKKAEIRESTELLLSLFRRHGLLQVRWIGDREVKVIRARGVEVGVIPKSAWKLPPRSR